MNSSSNANLVYIAFIFHNKGAIMEKSYSLTSLAVLSGVLIASPALMAKPLSIAMNPTSLTINVVCPTTQVGPYVLGNLGDYIGGYGYENICSLANNIYFKSSGLPSDIPHQLTNYYNSSVTYNSTSGSVSCSYSSNNQGEGNFSVNYTLTNGRGGVALSQSNNEINILLPVGFKTL
jgi:hypothetical protein